MLEEGAKLGRNTPFGKNQCRFGGSMLVLEEIKVMAHIEEAVTLAKAPWMLGDRFVNKEVIEKKEQPALIYADRPEDLPA